MEDHQYIPYILFTLFCICICNCNCVCVFICYFVVTNLSAKFLQSVRGVRAYYLSSKGSFPLYLCLCACPGNGQRWAYHNGEWSLGDH